MTVRYYASKIPDFFSFAVETSSPLEYTLTKLLGLLYYLISMHDIENVLG